MASDGKMEVQLPDDVARLIRFWDYFSNQDDSEFWGAGLHRYITPGDTNRLLGDILGALTDRPERDVLFKGLGGRIAPRPVRRLPLLRSAAVAPAIGFGGESEAHRRLKEHVAANPTAIGLPANARGHIEFGYVSGDAVDVKFDLPDGSFAVVEVETIVPFPGAHQCIKYRALLEAEQGKPLNSGEVEAILVAHSFDDQTRAFAAKYGIRLVKLKV